MSENSTEKKRWRDDPLSLFLAFGAVLLGLMYYLEERDIGQLEAASAEAQRIGSRLDVNECTTGSAGTGGTTLVFDCQGTRGDAAASLAAASPKISELFDAVVIAGNDGLLRCGTLASAWPNGCKEEPRPKPQEKGKAH